ncbi:glycosyltransferase family 87 protein [Pseudarthrobacter albicanus]|uniref:glycosyltransferase family 87 protein n=1 Tax=Pseudarthrobacter albicanus TaxID=2823873 RepID=UPI001BA844BB|nr:glycosyltransferase family 87 protein [Pseudarthrobacter albicanus]
MAYVAIKAAFLDNALGQDAHAYWLAGQGELVYDRVPGQQDAYLYSPAFLTVILPLAMLPWLLFLPMWICLEAAVLLWLLKPLRTRWFVPVFLLCTPELVVGNIYILLAGAAVIGMQKPAAWSFPILTKITAGVGLLWFAVRGEWGRLLQGVGGLAIVVIVSYALDPTQWHAWLQFLLENRDGTPDSRTSFLLRCFLAVVLVVIGARKQWPWLVAPAMVLASPVLVGLIPLTILAAIPRLGRLAAQNAVTSSSPLPDKAVLARKP